MSRHKVPSSPLCLPLQQPSPYASHRPRCRKVKEFTNLALVLILGHGLSLLRDKVKAHRVSLISEISSGMCDDSWKIVQSRALLRSYYVGLARVGFTTCIRY